MIYSLRKRPTDTGQSPKGSDKIGTVNSNARTVKACRIVRACTVQSQFGHWPYLTDDLAALKIQHMSPFPKNTHVEHKERAWHADESIEVVKNEI